MSPPAPVIKSIIQTRFKLGGFQLRLEACRHLESVLKPLEDDRAEVERWIDKILETVQSKNLDSAVIDKETVVAVIQVYKVTPIFAPLVAF